MLGESLALGAAIAWSVSLILFKRSEAIRPLGMNLFKNVVGIVLLTATLIVLGQGIDTRRPAEDWAKLLVSGVLGIGIADTLTFTALVRLGPALLAIIDCAYAPTVVLMSVLFLGERPGPRFLLGAALVVAGVAIATWQSSAPDPEAIVHRKRRVSGVLFALGGIVSMAIGVGLAKRPLERGSLPEVTLVRLVVGVAAQLIWIVVAPAERSSLRAFVPNPAWKTLIPAAIISAYISLMLWLGGFKWANASTAAVLNQMSSIFTLVLARVILHEPLTRRRALGGGVALAGALVVILR